MLQPAELEVLELDGNSTPSLGAVPPAIAEFLTANGYYGVFVRNDPGILEQYRTWHFKTLNVRDLPKKLGGLDARDYVQAHCTDPEANRGEIRKGDCVLVYRSFRAKDYWESVRRERLSRELGDPGLSNFRAALSEIQEAKGAHQLIREAPGNAQIGPATDHTVGGPDILNLDPEFRSAAMEELDKLAGR